MKTIRKILILLGAFCVLGFVGFVISFSVLFIAHFFATDLTPEVAFYISLGLGSLLGLVGLQEVWR